MEEDIDSLAAMDDSLKSVDIHEEKINVAKKDKNYG